MELVLLIIFFLSLLLFLYSYFGYFILLKILLKIFLKPIKIDSAFEPIVAIIIPVYNEENIISKKIENIFSLNYPKEKIEIWVGSDCSSDNTEKIVNRYKKDSVKLYRASDRIGKAGILNNIVPLVDAEMLLFTDADIIFHKDSIRHIVKNFADSSIGGVAGHTIHVGYSNNKKEENIYRSFEADQKKMESKLHGTISAFGSFYAIRKSLFIQFPKNSYSNDDVIMPMNIVRQGYRMIFEPEAISEEVINEDISTEFKRRIRIGAGNYQSFFWLLDFLNPLKGWPFFCYISHKVLRWFSPILLISIFLSCGFLAYISKMPLFISFFLMFNFCILIGLSYFGFPSRVTRPIYYFLLMNLALILGLFRYIRGIDSAIWSPTKR